MSPFSFLSPFNRLTIAALLVVSAAAYVLVPLNVDLPIHWNIDGNIDATAPAPLALAIAPLVGLALVLLFAALRRARLEKDFESGRAVIHAAISMTFVLLIGLEIVQIIVGRGGEVDLPRYIAFGIAALLIAVGNVLPKTQQNWVAGIRLPWTLRDENNWAATHRWTGRLMMGFGVVLFVVAVFGPTGPVLLPIILGAALIPVCAGIAISYGHAVRNQPR